MTIGALLFSLTDRSSGKLAGHGLVCPTANYATVKWHEEVQLDRRAASAAVWTALEDEIAACTPGTAPAPHSALARLLLHEDENIEMRCLTKLSLADTSRPIDVRDLDAILNAAH
jgi:hypothetical protein